MNWQSLPNNGLKVTSETVYAFLTKTTKVVEVRVTDIPHVDEVADPEMCADGCVSLMDRYDDLRAAHAQWVVQGWRPEMVEVEARHLFILHRESGKAFEATIDPEGAVEKAEDAIDRVTRRLRPAWMSVIEA